MCRRYSLDEILFATNGWSESNLIGSGAFGKVYRGRDPDRPDVAWAVKRASLHSNSFKKEVRMRRWEEATELAIHEKEL